MKEYYVFEISVGAEDTQCFLNRLAEKGWKLVCSYAHNNQWLIMERDKKICSKCGK